MKSKLARTPSIHWTFVLGSVALLGFGPGVAAAQSAADPDTNEEIVVTARRIAESQQDVPIAITALDQAELDRNRIQSLTDLQQFVPSASVTGYNSRNQEWFSLRGQGETGLETGGGVGGGPAVVGYLAEVPVAIAGPGLYYDLASVQVLNGPQGTLFGRNTTGGAILFEPRLPSEAFEGYLTATVGDYGRTEFGGALNLPINSVLSVRLAGQTGHRDGYTHDVVQDVDYQERDFDAVRLGVLFEPTAQVESYFLANYVDYEETGSGNVLLAVNPGNAALVAALADQGELGIRHTSHSVTGEYDRGRFLTLLNRTSFEINDQLTLRNIVSWSHRQTSRRVDEDGSPLIILDSTGPLPGTWHKNQEVFTEELQLQGQSGDGHFRWQVGGYYEDGSNPENMSFSQQFAPTFFLSTFEIDQANTSKGLYAQGTLALDSMLDGLSLTAGYRHTWDEISFGVAFAGSATMVPSPGDPCFSVAGEVYPDNCLVTDSASHDGDSYTLGLDWRMSPSTLLYLVTRQGYKSGGFNIVATQLGATDSDYYTYLPETVRDIEFGVKTDWRAGGVRGRTNAALYYSEYSDAQVLTAAVVGGSVQGVTANAASATISGFELQNTIWFSDWVELNLTYSNMDAGYDRYITPLGNDLSNTPYPNAPENRLAAGARFRMPLPATAGELWLGATYTYQDEIYVGIGDNGPGSPANTQDEHSLVNLRADWTSVLGSKFDLAVFVTNATDEEYLVTNLDLYNALGYATGSYGEPRMAGVTLRRAF
ncbi:TonB-dependent receptor [Terricaulis silvestris]|uniref:Enterobactin receptor protein n=1 Tax=Terricaulis silvestris TaxID=2686094 RepID=A0A6I6MH21_9CAUL|nr:TonB-dependent receptor plug domain-containing protein [Terricaulis silvestris]QGZ93649.1 enterobactin receptor protein [Terricaulis silvestris]